MEKLETFFEKIEQTKIIPAVKIETLEDAIPVANALSQSQINIIEITYRSKVASAAIEAISKNCPQIIVGAGTVTNLKIAKNAVSKGAQFIIMPGFDEKTVDWCIKKNIPVIPGVATPTEIMTCKNKGLKVLKFFPATTCGAIEFLKAIKGPFADIKFIPTGGINEDNAKEYLSLANVIAVGGSWLTKPQFLKEKNFEIISAEAEKSISSIIN